jgi:hypothetical protein
LYGALLTSGAVVAAVLVALFRALVAVASSARELQRAAAAVVVATEAVVRACNEVEPLARDIRIDVESARQTVASTVKQPLARVSDDLASLKTTLAVTAASVLAALSYFAL